MPHFFCAKRLLLMPVFLVFAAPSLAADNPVHPVWPGKPPGETADIGPERLLAARELVHS